MIRKHINAAGAGCNEKVRNRGGVAGRAGTKEDHVGKVLLHKRTKYLEVTSVSAGIIAGRRTTYRSEVRLVHELRGGDGAADRAGIGEEAARLVRLPDAGRIAGARAYRERRHDPCPNRLREIDHASPLLTGQNPVESIRRCGWRR